MAHGGHELRFQPVDFDLTGYVTEDRDCAQVFLSQKHGRGVDGDHPAIGEFHPFCLLRRSGAGLRGLRPIMEDVEPPLPMFTEGFQEMGCRLADHLLGGQAQNARRCRVEKQHPVAAVGHDHAVGDGVQDGV